MVRIHQSGDFYSNEYLQSWIDIVKMFNSYSDILICNMYVDIINMFNIYIGILICLMFLLICSICLIYILIF